MTGLSSLSLEKIAGSRTFENERKEKIRLENEKKQEEILKVKLKEQALREEARLEKQRTKEKGSGRCARGSQGKVEEENL